jgi:hypothetical protein
MFFWNSINQHCYIKRKKLSRKDSELETAQTELGIGGIRFN